VSEEHFDAVVVGSGFGGSVMTYRLAEAGMSVCLLERGKAYPPGSFPRSPWETGRNFWDPSEGMHGLFDVWSFRGLGGIVASGLGGGSLIWSNVVLRKDRSTFVKESLAEGGLDEFWPVDYDDLEPHYARHEKMLRATPYPFDRPPYDRTYKTRAMQYASGKLGLEWILAPLAVSFAGPDSAPGEPVPDDPPNLHGRTRLTCRLCGECNIGCNYGSKNTLDFNYLSEASLRHGALIRTRCEVKTFAPREGGGYTIDYVDHAEAVEGEKRKGELPRHTITADRLVLSAGVFGTTYLLLRNRGAFPKLSEALGTHLCGNGDILMLALESKEDDGSPRIVDPGYGPVITSTVRVPDAAEGGPGRAYYIQDGGHPQIVNWKIEAAWQLGILRRLIRFAARLVWLWLRRTRRSEIGREAAAAFGPATLSSTSFPLFNMGRDIPDGRMTLTSDGYLDADWSNRRSNALFENVRKTGREITRVLNAKFQDNLPWYLGRSITVHGLGGCPMGRDEKEGVVDSYGRVFNYPGLYVADGSVLPGPVGPNPSTTIAALSHRFAEQIIAEARPGQPEPGTTSPDS